MVTKGIFVCEDLKLLLVFPQYYISFLQVSPWIELHPSGLSIIAYIFLLIFFSIFAHTNSHEIQWY